MKVMTYVLVLEIISGGSYRWDTIFILPRGGGRGWGGLGPEGEIVCGQDMALAFICEWYGGLNSETVFWHNNCYF